ncbi:hypothetical protein BT96DRAFT_942709 [Gymnopus androsaceus JB14]|uniref:Uncharacterized protein n=1 Tax=Gymnopus androsaceus JB14 TaxID=1447944 RepID=A0A6A4HAL5_9AGAR|nr:hypothetical protein BT96DRAFT_942709 [Gymnopus androsaceus JB14]
MQTPDNTPTGMLEVANGMKRPKSMAKRTLRSLSVSAADGTGKGSNEQEENEKLVLRCAYTCHFSDRASDVGVGVGSAATASTITIAFTFTASTFQPLQVRGEREREHGSTAKPTGTPSSLDPAGHGRRKESKKQSEKEGRRWKDQRGEWEKDKDKGIEKATTRIKDVNSGRKASSSSRTAEKTPIYTRFNTVEKRR